MKSLKSNVIQNQRHIQPNTWINSLVATIETKESPALIQLDMTCFTRGLPLRFLSSPGRRAWHDFTACIIPCAGCARVLSRHVNGWCSCLWPSSRNNLNPCCRLIIPRCPNQNQTQKMSWNHWVDIPDQICLWSNFMILILVQFCIYPHPSQYCHTFQHDAQSIHHLFVFLRIVLHDRMDELADGVHDVPKASWESIIGKVGKWLVYFAQS